MAKSPTAARNWSERVRFAPQDKAYAYAPNRFLVRVPPGQLPTVRVLIPGAEPVTQGEGQGEEAITLFGGYQQWRFTGGGDVLSAVRLLKASGFIAQPVHMFFLDAGPNDVNANPVYANPVYANPVYANPVYANPVYANPVYANPVYANSGCGHPGCGCSPGCSRCLEFDRCLCVPDPPAAQASRVYPNPLYATTAYPNGEGVTYQRTGERRSEARPLLGMPANQIGVVGNWATALVRVAVIDSGLPNATSTAFLPTPANLVGGDPIDNPDANEDEFLDPVAGHGTFIAGIIARVAPGCAISVYHALTTFGDGNEADIVTLIERLATQPVTDRPHVLNLSFSGYALDEPGCMRNAIQMAIAAGIVVVASAGNDGISRKAYPAAFEGVVSVAALGPNGPAPFSNWGSWVRACAPGVDVPSTFWEFNGQDPQKFGLDIDNFVGWATWSGTSFAAPVVAGVIAKSMMGQGISGNEAVEVLIDQPGLLRLPCYGTVINELAAKPRFT